MQDPDDETLRDVDNDEFYELFECAAITTGRTIMHRRGFDPLRPDEVPDNETTGRLWELLYALAGHRCFFHGTDGFTDAELYRYLDAWLDEPHEDIPLCLEMNCRHDCSDAGNGGFEFLKYADDEERARWLEMDPTIELPPKETLPADRDRHMPEPPHPPVAADLPAWPDMDAEEDDPLGLASVDAAIAASRLDEELQDTAPLIPENWERPAAVLQSTGYTPVPPDELTAETTAPYLWELLHHLALRNFFVTHTDHLSDTDLYAELWHKALREESLLPAERTRTGYWMHDILGSYGTDECNLHLALYATDAERTRHTEQFPNWPLPEKRERLTRRDWRLPRPPF